MPKAHVRRREKLEKRDGMICQICFGRIYREQDRSIDHIVPRSLGGTDALTNLQLTHRWCNFAKNRFVDTPMLKGMEPEGWKMGNYALIHSLPCSVCARYGVDVHHWKTKGSGGSDHLENLVPLCRRHHTEFHTKGRKTFWKIYQERIKMHRKLFNLPPLPEQLTP